MDFMTAHRGDDQFIARLMPGMRDALKARAKANRRSMNSELLSILNTALNEKGPAATAIAPDRGSNLMEIRKMNETTDTTAPVENLPPQPLSLQLLDITNAADSIKSLVLAMQYAVEGLQDKHARRALAEVCDILSDRMSDLITDIGAVREQAA